MVGRRQLSINLPHFDIDLHLLRLTDTEYCQLHTYGRPIKEDDLFLFRLFYGEQNNPNRLSLGKALVVLEDLLGPSSMWFDDRKGSFSFPLLVVVQRETGQFFYLMNLRDYRGDLSYSLYRISADDIPESNLRAYCEPFPEEFSREEINGLFTYLYGYLKGCAKFIDTYSLQPFYRTVDSNFVIYGYWDGQFFEQDFESREEYEATLKEPSYAEMDRLAMTQQQETIRKTLEDLLTSITE